MTVARRVYAAAAPLSATKAPTLNELAQGRMDDIFQSGLHEFIQDFLARNNRLGLAVAEQYLV